MRCRLTLYLILCMGIFSTAVPFSWAYASFFVSPQIITLEPTGRKSQEWASVRHMGDTDLPMAIEMRVVKRELDISGRVFHISDETDENFVIYPAQMILYPGEMQMVYVQWAGNALPDKELVYSLIVENVPIDLKSAKKDEEEKAKARIEVRTLVRYEGLIFVRPPKVTPDVVVESANVEMDEAGKPQLIVVLYNQGSARQKLGGMSLTVVPVQGDHAEVDKAVAYKPPLPKDQTTHSLYAGYRRRCVIPWPESIPVGPVKVTVTFE
jgi:P pilus assembly chaperone PapD